METILETSGKSDNWSVETKEKYAEIIRSLSEHENVLLNMRFSWLMTFQGFLFASLGISLKEKYFELTIILCIIGVIVSISMISARKVWKTAIENLGLWWEENLKAYDGPPKRGLEESNKMTLMRFFRPWRILPLTFMVSWIIILIYCVVRYV